MDSDSNLSSAAEVENDASAARAFAIGLEGASAERFEATMKVLLNFYGCDSRRIAAAATHCRAQHQKYDWLGWDEGADLLEQALQRLRDAGADAAESARTAFAEQLHDELHPEPQPFTWPAQTARERRWLRRAWVHARVRWQRQKPRHPGAHQLLLLRIGRARVGKLDYQVCDECRRGYVRKLDVEYRYRGLGLGTRAIRVARRGREHYGWSTTVHYLTSGTFWSTIGLQADPRGECPHMGRP